MKFLLKNKNLILLVIAVFLGCLVHPELKDSVLFALKAIVLFLSKHKKFELEVSILEFLILVLESF